MADYHTPGVFVQENAFPVSIIATDTAIPVFIGYTAKSLNKHKTLTGTPVKIFSLAEYENYFGNGITLKCMLQAATTKSTSEIFDVKGTPMEVTIKAQTKLYMYDSLRLFYANGGGACYVLSVGTYNDINMASSINITDFTGDGTKPSVFTLLEKENEPTIIVLPDATMFGKAAYTHIYNAALQHCDKMQNRIVIFDLIQNDDAALTNTVVTEFRDAIHSMAASYGAAYYPWLKTNITQPAEITLENLDASVDLQSLLPEKKALELLGAFEAGESTTKQLHEALYLHSPTYQRLRKAILDAANELPSSGAVAGAYVIMDQAKGVWKAPANISLNKVLSPVIKINDQAQENLNIDVLQGKSVNVIRSFTGMGVLIWGARTLDSNNTDIRHISVKRTLIMIEQSIKHGLTVLLFEPNNSNTWMVAKSMIEHFLVNLWKAGALAGNNPADAFSVIIGAGISMTPEDLQMGIMRISVLIALNRPAEFIVLTFQQQQQAS